jgi:hypothetical protein
VVFKEDMENIEDTGYMWEVSGHSLLAHWMHAHTSPVLYFHLPRPHMLSMLQHWHHDIIIAWGRGYIFIVLNNFWGSQSVACHVIAMTTHCWYGNYSHTHIVISPVAIYFFAVVR